MVEIDCRDRTPGTVAFLVDGKHFVTGGGDGKIRRWRTEDGKEVGIPMEVGNAVLDITVSQDGKWVVCGTIGDGVMVWNLETHEQLPIGFKTGIGMVFAIDVSPDGTKIAAGSGMSTAFVLSLSTAEQLLGPLEHDNAVIGVKFSSDGRLIATATEYHSNSVRIYDSQTGSFLIDFAITISDSTCNQTLAWGGESKQLFALSRDGHVHCLDVSTGTTLSQWPIHGRYPPASIALASNGKFVAAAADTKVSFWDTTTNEAIGSVIDHTDPVTSMVISSNYDIVTTTGFTISILRLRDFLPPPYLDVTCGEEISPMDIGTDSFEETSIPHVREGNALLDETVKSLVADIRDLREKNVTLESTVRSLRAELDESKLNIESLRAQNEGSDRRIARLEAMLQGRFGP